MRTKLILILNLLPALAGTVRAQGTAFTYQGRLSSDGAPANGSYDFMFQLFDAGNGDAGQSAILLMNGVPVADGLFVVALNFGASAFNAGAPRWLEIQVRTNGSSGFATLSPRQALTATPYAITAGTLTGPVGAASLSGTYTNAMTFSNASNQFTGRYAGNGGGLTDLVGFSILPPANDSEITYSWEGETNNPNGYGSITNKGLTVVGASEPLFQALTNHLVVTNFGGGECLYVTGGPGQPALYITKHFASPGAQRIKGVRVKYFVTTNEANNANVVYARTVTTIAGSTQFASGNVLDPLGQMLHLSYGSYSYGLGVWTNGLFTTYTNEDIASRNWWSPYYGVADNYWFLQTPTVNAQLISGWEFTSPNSIRVYTSGQPDMVRTLDYFTNFQAMVDFVTETMESDPSDQGMQYCIQSITVYFYSPNTTVPGYYTTNGFQVIAPGGALVSTLGVNGLASLTNGYTIFSNAYPITSWSALGNCGCVTWVSNGAVSAVYLICTNANGIVKARTNLMFSF